MTFKKFSLENIKKVIVCDQEKLQIKSISVLHWETLFFLKINIKNLAKIFDRKKMSFLHPQKLFH